ncbi:Phosphopantetheine adenylyltransferase [Frankliniella fusca]|uniref:Phosphopantetheine adenylyltransferase n=1 Tax=Frankliniella fusca TaxID=407009 RepID=A0AAE1LK89_9NEOP|nr:Phosphopantetheine adenylyltransferase [Frankliniella fusca]
MHCVSLLATRWREVGGLSDVRVQMPQSASPGDDVYMRCLYNLDNDVLYTVKWYKGRQEFFRYVPKELPNTKVFPLPGVNVDGMGSQAARLPAGF